MSARSVSPSPRRDRDRRFTVEGRATVVAVVVLQNVADVSGAAEQEHGPPARQGEPDEVALLAPGGLEYAEHIAPQLRQ